jgi:tRNA nucleotidyltransferase/poly(A) polymerase
MTLSPPPFVRGILTTFLKADFQVYIVGGAVRDLLLKRPTYDWDFTTNATPEQILKLFPDAFYDNNYGTVMATDPRDEQLHRQGKLEKIPLYDLTTFRHDVGYSDKRHPDSVHWGKTLEEDLMRRDFTIGAMALKPEKPATSRFTFQLLDPFHGQDDLQARLVRAVGDPHQRFAEDALRMLRAIRIAAQLGFTIEPATLSAIKTHASQLSHISAERIRDELLKSLATDYPADAVTLMSTSGLLHQIIPELEATRGIEQGKHHTDDVWTHSLKSLRFCPSPDPIVRLATLIHDVGKASTRRFLCQHCHRLFKAPPNLSVIQRRNPVTTKNLSSISKSSSPSSSFRLDRNPTIASTAKLDPKPTLTCPHCSHKNDYRQSVTFYNHEMASTKIAQKLSRRLRLSNHQAAKLITLVRYHMFTVDDRQTDKAIRRFIRHVGKENLDDMLALRIGDRLGGGARETSWRLEKFKKRLIEVQKQPFTVRDLKIDGHDVMKILKIKPGPQVGRLLEKLFNQVVDKKLKNTKTALIKALKTQRSPSPKNHPTS